MPITTIHFYTLQPQNRFELAITVGIQFRHGHLKIEFRNHFPMLFYKLWMFLRIEGLLCFVWVVIGEPG